MSERSKSSNSSTPDDSAAHGDEIIDLYLQNVPDYLNDLNRAFADNDSEAICFHAHKLRSTVAIMGFNNIAELLREIEHESPGKHRLRELSAQVTQMIQHTLNMLQSSRKA